MMSLSSDPNRKLTNAQIALNTFIKITINWIFFSFYPNVFMDHAYLSDVFGCYVTRQQDYINGKLLMPSWNQSINFIFSYHLSIPHYDSNWLFWIILNFFWITINNNQIPFLSYNRLFHLKYPSQIFFLLMRKNYNVWWTYREKYVYIIVKRKWGNNLLQNSMV